MKIGIYGGTFNPPHLGHLTAAAAVIATLKLDKLLLNLSGDGTYASFDESDLALGYVDMRQ